ncbi:tRNA glutamyl-Q(34) synthetase GluQRS [Desertibaculum subflavum]|uniref:tRNA glutamyl-Q(34) synthetase GluQRS n=1 Tax=Desertibaculum subflavum TaxID=2268458 RepID=UPI000E6722D5
MTVTRFAPSPTGHLHLGHAYSALFAAARGDRFLLRIEDIDITRCRPEFEAAIYQDLAWLGLEWEMPVRRQSEHLDDYRHALGGLESRGVLYPCFCTRRQIKDEIARSPSAPHGPDGPLYPGTCRRLDDATRARRMADSEDYALRLDAARAAALTGPLTFVERGDTVAVDPGLLGDVVLARKEIPTSYHLAVVVDDALQGVTLVTRGQDLLPATHVHRLLQALLGLPAPAYHHHGFVLGPDGKRLAKRDGAQSLRALRDAGRTPAEVRAMAVVA